MRYAVEIGTDFRFEAEDFKARPQRISELDPIATQLSVDEMTIRVKHWDEELYEFAPSDADEYDPSDADALEVLYTSLLSIPYGTPVRLVDNDGLVAEMYYVEASQLGLDTFEILAASPIGFLDRQEHSGGVYTTETAGEVIAELISGAFEYSISEDVAAEPIRGWLPKDTARNNLHKVLFALGASVLRDEDGKISIQFLEDTDALTVPDSRVFLGGKVDYSKPVTAVEVTQHAYFRASGAEEEELYNNVGAPVADGLMITFSEPCYDLRGDGLMLGEVGANYAVVYGTGSLYGKRYAHTTQIVRRGEVTSDERSVVTVTDCGLVNGLNAANVANRLWAFYHNRREMTVTLKLEDEKAGDKITVRGPDGLATGLISRLETAYSSFGKALATVVSGYTPEATGNTYNAFLALSEGQTWTAETAGKVQIVCIGGGDGGDGGGSGQTGYSNDESRESCDGGAAGAPGLPGRVYVAEYELAAGDSVTATAVGAGGEGGAGGVAPETGGASAPGEAGAAGEDSLATVVVGGSSRSVSSAAGVRPTGGYYNLIDGSLHAVAGVSGVAGGASNGENSAGNVVEEWAPGEDPQSMEKEYYWPAARTFQVKVTSGFGGGAAHGADGEAGARWSTNPPVVNEDTEVVDTAEMPSPIGGDGGDGADAAGYSAAAEGYGSGGSGGHGGGGGGCGGAGYVKTGSTPYAPGGTPGEGGRGGTGSDGQDGGDGAVLIYFRR